MNNWGDILALGLDAVVFCVCSNFYFKFRKSVRLVEDSQSLGINPDFDKIDDVARGYVIYQGKIKALDKPIRAMYASDVTGVVQRLTIREHNITRNAAGFWSDHKNIVHDSYNLVPFAIERGKTFVHVLDPLGAEVLDLDTVYNKFENTSLSMMDHVIGFFNGVKQQGLGTTEELLKEGCIITVIGEISKNPEGELQLGPPVTGHPYFITSMPASSLLRNLKQNRNIYKYLALLCGGIGVVLAYNIFKKWYSAYQDKKRDEEIARRLETTRVERRRKARTSSELQEHEKCVICKDNPKEIIILNCGHVCLCEDCSLMVHSHCPVCREKIAAKAAAFIS